MKGFHQQSSLLLTLTKHHVVSPKMVDKISAGFISQKRPLISYLVEEHGICPEHIATVLSRIFDYPLIDLAHLESSYLPRGIRNEKLIRKHNALPLYLRGKVLYVAMSDPTNVDALEEIQFNTGFSTELVLVNEKTLSTYIENILNEGIGLFNILDNVTDDISEIDTHKISRYEYHQDSDDISHTNKEDAPIIVYINKILLEAIRKGASDLHFEPYDSFYRIRFRIDGLLSEVAKPPLSLASRMAARLKVMAKLDIAERRLPQDGRIRLVISKEKSIDFRLSTLPIMCGEKIVMRILDSSTAILGIDMLGYTSEQKRIYLAALAQSQGMILVTGPTGSGKTVSLYAGLNILNTEQRNISTIEDPVEININGINQVQINTKYGLTFPNALRSFLRQDPDIIMIGEIRDFDTAEIAIKAAQTGHLVLSTLHTNSAAETLTRLLNMGIPAYNVASSVTVIIAQRLARRLCNQCKKQIHVPDSELIKQGLLPDQLNNISLYRPVGCDLCTEGYKGRVGIYEVINISDITANLIMTGGNSLDIATQCQREGYNNLRQAGLEKAILGITSLEEVNRVTNA